MLAKYMRGTVIDEVVKGYHHDALLNVTGISSHEGASLQTASYSAFGDKVVASFGATNNRLTYTGREKDDTGFYYYRARYYDPAIGRFISEDPLGFSQGVNFYAYVNNNPVNVNTWVNTLQLPAGSYSVSPRPYINATPLQAAFDFLTFSDRNAHVGRPTLSNTNNWNTVAFPDGSLHNAIQIHPGRTAAGGGISNGCLVCSDAEFGQLNATFQKNYSNGGVSLNVLPGSIQDAFPSLKIAPRMPADQGTGGGTPSTFKLDTNFGSMSDLGGAAGGFLLYPNKANTNQMQSVYSK